MSETDLTPVSVEDASGRILTGVGASTDDLTATMERFAPEVPADASRPADVPPTSADAAASAPAGAADQKPTRGQKRFSQLSSERDQEAHKRAEVERERDELKARIAALESRAPSPVPAPAAVSPAAPGPSPAKFTFPTFDAWLAQNPGKEWDDWNDEKIAGRARFEYSQQQLDIDARIRQGIEADSASRAFQTTIKSVMDRGRASHTDFDAVFAGAKGMIGPTQESDLQRAQLVYQQPNAHDLIYAIARDPQVAQALARMSDVQFGMALASLAPAPAVASPASTAGAGSVMPPPPYQPVGSGSKTTVTPSAELAGAGFDFDKSGYREKRAAERNVTRRR